MPASHLTTSDSAFIIHKRAFKESSLIVELFCRSVGRKTVIAKGAKSKQSKYNGILEPFNLLRVTWTGKSDLATLTLAERCQEPLKLCAQPLFCGLYLNELVVNLLQHNDPHPQLFDNYQTTINHLQQSDDLEPILRHFELSLLNDIGYGLQLDHDSQTGELIQHSRFYRYITRQGLVASESMNDALVSGATLLALSRNQPLNSQHRREAKQLLRRIIDDILEGKPLRSRDLFRTIQTT
ncbi:MAG: DNA repair protein RecO [Gammaproteobacteria bacterium]|nr:DNA repair protein RecO [Gammaproteobacteria bacterium]